MNLAVADVQILAGERSPSDMRPGRSDALDRYSSTALERCVGGRALLVVDDVHAAPVFR